MVDSESFTRPLVPRGAGLAVPTLRIDVTAGPDVETHATPITSSDEEITVGTAATNTLVLTDPTVSRFHATFQAVPGGILVIDRGSTNGIVVANVRVERGVVSPGAIVRVGRTSLRVSHGFGGAVELFPEGELDGLLGGTDEMRRLMNSITRVASSTVPVLIVGESGTGKDLVARAIHQNGGQSRRPLVTVDCGALPGSLLASELFGHERGAFTGADRTRKGAFELADGGTLFLDEIGELPLEHQPALLGALERQRFRRVGGSTEINVNVRVVCATHRDLPRCVNEGTFRLDLYYRLAVVSLRVPSLRDRIDDIPLLARHFASQLGAADTFDECFPPASIEHLKRHAWPGNVRELRNFVEATLALGASFGEQESVVEGSGPSRDLGSEGISEQILKMPYHLARSRVVGNLERQAVQFWLRECGGNVSSAAKRMGINRSHLYSLLDRHRLVPTAEDGA